MSEQIQIKVLNSEVDRLKKALALSESKREFLLSTIDDIEALWSGCFKELREELETENEALKKEVEELRKQLKENESEAYSIAAEPQAPYGE